MKHQAEMQPLFPHLALPLGRRVVGIEEGLPIHQDAPPVGSLQKIQAPQQGGLAAARGSNNGKSLSLLQGEADILQHPGRPEVLFHVFCK